MHTAGPASSVLGVEAVEAGEGDNENGNKDHKKNHGAPRHQAGGTGRSRRWITEQVRYVSILTEFLWKATGPLMRDG